MSMDGSPYGTLTDTTLKLKRNTKCIKENRYKTRYKTTRKTTIKQNKCDTTVATPDGCGVGITIIGAVNKLDGIIRCKSS